MLGFAFDSFRFDYSYWGVVMLARNMAMCVIATSDNAKFEGGHFQGFLAIIVGLIYLMSVLLCRPFIYNYLNLCEALLVSCEVSFHKNTSILTMHFIVILPVFPCFSPPFMGSC